MCRFNVENRFQNHSKWAIIQLIFMPRIIMTFFATTFDARRLTSGRRMIWGRLCCPYAFSHPRFRALPENHSLFYWNQDFVLAYSNKGKWSRSLEYIYDITKMEEIEEIVNLWINWSCARSWWFTDGGSPLLRCHHVLYPGKDARLHANITQLFDLTGRSTGDFQICLQRKTNFIECVT